MHLALLGAPICLAQFVYTRPKTPHARAALSVSLVLSVSFHAELRTPEMASSTRTSPLSVITAIRDYVTKMVTDVAGMKVLVMDAETTGIVSMVYTQTQILQVRLYARRRFLALTSLRALTARGVSH